MILDDVLRENFKLIKIGGKFKSEIVLTWLEPGDKE